MENKWYYVKDGVEYSSDLKFFMKEQVTFSTRNESYPELTIFSRLDGRVFLKDKTVCTYGLLGIKDLEARVPELMAKIHKEIFEGKYYQNGKIID